jgi:hypothetical protein
MSQKHHILEKRKIITNKLNNIQNRIKNNEKNDIDINEKMNILKGLNGGLKIFK